MGQASKYRSVRLGCAGVDVERGERGRISLRSRQALAPYPARLTARLLQWAGLYPRTKPLAR